MEKMIMGRRECGVAEIIESHNSRGSDCVGRIHHHARMERLDFCSWTMRHHEQPSWSHLYLEKERRLLREPHESSYLLLFFT
jgi:hypothetical protein